MIFGGTSLGCCVGRRPLCLVRLLLMSCFFFSNFLFILVITSDLFLVLHFVVKERPELESKFEERVQAAIKYIMTIDDFDELIDPRTLARHCLGPKPSLYVLSTLDEKRENVSCLCIWDHLIHFLFVLTFYFLWCRDDDQV